MNIGYDYKWYFGTKLTENILLDTISANRAKGCWERMFLCQVSEAFPAVEIVTADPLTPPLLPPLTAREAEETTTLDVLMSDGNEPMRELLDEVEWVAFYEEDFAVAWARSEIRISGWAMKYGDHLKEMEKQENASSKVEESEDVEDGEADGEDVDVEED